MAGESVSDGTPEYRLGYRLALGYELSVGLGAHSGTTRRRPSRRTVRSR